MVRPLFDYCAVVWDSYSQGSGSYSDKLNRRAACINEGRELSTIFGWPHLQARCNFLKYILVYKCINEIAPSCVNSTPISQDNVISYGCLWPKPPSTGAVLGLTVRMPTIPSPPIRAVKDFNKFKSLAKRYFKSQAAIPWNPSIFVFLLTFSVLLSLHNSFVLIR